MLMIIHSYDKSNENLCLLHLLFLKIMHHHNVINRNRNSAEVNNVALGPL